MIPKFNRTASGKLKRMDHYKKNESRKQERLHFERKLQSNLDQYVTRAVTELVYRVPEDVDAARPETRQTSPGHGDSLHLPMLSEAMFKERFPIPIEVCATFDVGREVANIREFLPPDSAFARPSCNAT